MPKKKTKDISGDIYHQITESKMAKEFYELMSSDKAKEIGKDALKMIIYGFITFASAQAFGKARGEAMGATIADRTARDATQNRVEFENTLRELNISPVETYYPDLHFAEEARAEVIPQRATAEAIPQKTPSRMLTQKDRDEFNLRRFDYN